MLQQGDSMDEALQKLRAFFGWSRESQMPVRYARAVFEDRLSSVWNDALDERVSVLRAIPPRPRLERDMARNENIQWQLEAGACEIVAQLPSLPPVIRYYDDFDGKQRSIRDPANAKCFAVHIDGRVVKVGFDHLSEQLALLIKHVFLYLLGEGLAPSSARRPWQQGNRRGRNRQVVGGSTNRNRIILGDIFARAGGSVRVREIYPATAMQISTQPMG